jgi:hypothetical protein
LNYVEIGWNPWGFLPHFLPPAQFSVGTRDTPQFQETTMNDLQGDHRFLE